MTDQRPSDELTTKAVEIANNIIPGLLVYDGEDFAYFPAYGCCTDVYRDPRDNTDAALELLRHTIGSNRGTYNGNGLFFRKYGVVPICGGQPFRHAVVNLAIEIMEIKDD